MPKIFSKFVVCDISKAMNLVCLISLQKNDECNIKHDTANNEHVIFTHILCVYLGANYV